MLSNRSGKLRSEYRSDYVVFDLETTGVSWQTDAVVELSALRVQNGAVTEEFTSLVNPGRPIPFQASQVNGITDEMVAGSPEFKQVLSEFMCFAKDAVLVGHNIHSFDMKFLYRDAERFWRRSIDNDYIDTLRLARLCLPQLSRHRLTDLAAHYGFETAGAHRALSDCRMNQQVYEALGASLAVREQRPGGGGSVMGSAKGQLGERSTGLRLCPRCGSPMQLRSGRFGEFWGCTGYPRCRYTENA